MSRLQYLCALMLLMALPLCAADKIKLDEVLARHLDSIGSAEARAAVKDRSAEGTAQMRRVVGGTNAATGPATLMSTDHKFRVAMSFAASNYPGEVFVFDGEKAGISFVAAGARSPLGNFLFNQQEILRDGLLGGTLFTAWPLLHLDDKQPKLKYDGIKKVGGQELHQVSYSPRKGADGLQIRLYFDLETFRHVKTVYRFEPVRDAARSKTEQTENLRYVVEEEFADFQVTDGLTLPRAWTMRYEVQPSTGALEWSIAISQISHNQP